MVVRVAILGACTAATMRALDNIQGAEVVVVGCAEDLSLMQEQELRLERMRSPEDIVIRCEEKARDHVDFPYYHLERKRTHPTTARELRRAERGRRR